MKETLLQLRYTYINWKLVKSAFNILLETDIYLRSANYKIKYNWLTGMVYTSGNPLVTIVLNLNRLELRITHTRGMVIRSYIYTHYYNKAKNRFEEIHLV